MKFGREQGGFIKILYSASEIAELENVTATVDPEMHIAISRTFTAMANSSQNWPVPITVGKAMAENITAYLISKKALTETELIESFKPFH